MRRINSFDCIRAICMLWIVGFWHMAGYIGWEVSNNRFFLNFTYGCLATFFFISGELSSRHTIKNFKDGILYLKKRWVAIYPLYLVSVITLTIFGWFQTKCQFCIALLGMTALFPPQPMTIWFVSDLFIFYFITSFIMPLSRQRRKITLFVLYFVLLIEKIKVGWFDERLVLYFPAYFMVLS